jgi:hypothetical protein
VHNATGLKLFCSKLCLAGALMTKGATTENITRLVIKKKFSKWKHISYHPKDTTAGSHIDYWDLHYSRRGKVTQECFHTEEEADTCKFRQLKQHATPNLKAYIRMYIGGWGEPTGKSFCFVRACARCGCKVGMRLKRCPRGFPFSERAGFPFSLEREPPPSPQPPIQLQLALLVYIYIHIA